MPASTWPTGSTDLFSESPYFERYEQSKEPWRLSVSEVDGEVAVIVMELTGDNWTAGSAVFFRRTESRRGMSVALRPRQSAGERPFAYPPLAAVRARYVRLRESNLQLLPPLGEADLDKLTKHHPRAWRTSSTTMAEAS